MKEGGLKQVTLEDFQGDMLNSDKVATAAVESEFRMLTGKQIKGSI